MARETREQLAERIHEGVDDRLDRRSEEEQGKEDEQRQVLVEIPVGLAYGQRKHQGDQPRAVEPGDRQQMEEREREVRELERHQDREELQRRVEPDDETCDRREGHVRDRARQTDEDAVPGLATQIVRLDRWRL